jgi:hypothetical protein
LLLPLLLLRLVVLLEFTCSTPAATLPTHYTVLLLLLLLLGALGVRLVLALALGPVLLLFLCLPLLLPRLRC